MIALHRHASDHPMNLCTYITSQEISIPYLQFPELEALGMIHHVFSTRLGGSSRGIFESMNLSFTRGDRTEDVRENYHRIASLMEAPEDQFVLSMQTHTTNIRTVTSQDAGMGLTKPLTYQDVDGLITNVPGLVLSIFAADCTPLLFVDPVHHAIGASHAGWRGTVNNIGAKTIERMHEVYGTMASDLHCAIGPSISKEHYEISEEVAQPFLELFKDRASEILIDNGFNPDGEHKYHLDLWAANRILLEKAGVPASRIYVTDLCTYENHDLLFSHRYTRGQRGNNGVFIKIKETSQC